MNPTTEAIRPLPRQIRPRPGETVGSFVDRLARANHLRPSHLRRFLRNNPNTPYGGSTNPARLAALTGRKPAILSRAFQPPTLGRPTTPIRRLTNKRHRRQREKPELFAEIRDAANEPDISIRALASRFQVHRRTIRQALTAPTPQTRKKPVRQSHALNGLLQHIDAILHADPDIPAGHIWERLIDEHHATMSYSTLRTHIARQRRNQQHPSDPQPGQVQ